MRLTKAELPRRYWMRVAERNGISQGNFRRRLYEWGDIERAATQPLIPGTPRARSGSKGDKLRKAGLNRTSLDAWRRRHPDSRLTDDEVIEVILANKKDRQDSLDAKARKAGLHPSTVRKRLRSGLPLELALTLPLVSDHEKGLRGKRVGWGKHDGGAL